MSGRMLGQITVADLKQKSSKVKCKKVLLMLLYVVMPVAPFISDSGIAHADIVFKEGWDVPPNNDVHVYTQQGATTFLSAYSSDLEKAIDSPSCKITVTQGCHQPNDPHFTLNGEGSKKSCKSSYAGSKSVHVGPCP